MKTEIVTITPDKARQMLATNKGNRKIRWDAVSTYAKQMKAGEWQLNGETISVDLAGNLLNGQHRLNACIEANTPFETVIVVGLPREAFATIDTGRNRTVSTILNMEGYKASNRLAAAVRLIMVWKSGERRLNHYGRMRNPYSNQQVLEYCRENPKEVELIYECLSRYPIACKLMSYSGACMMYVLTMEKEPSLAETFFRSLNGGFAANEDDAVLTLRNRYINMSMEKKKDYRSGDKISLFLRCWNNIRAGKSTVKQIQPYVDVLGDIE